MAAGKGIKPIKPWMGRCRTRGFLPITVFSAQKRDGQIIIDRGAYIQSISDFLLIVGWHPWPWHLWLVVMVEISSRPQECVCQRRGLRKGQRTCAGNRCTVGQLVSDGMPVDCCWNFMISEGTDSLTWTCLLGYDSNFALKLDGLVLSMTSHLWFNQCSAVYLILLNQIHLTGITFYPIMPLKMACGSSFSQISLHRNP